MERTGRREALEPVDYHIHTVFSADSPMEPLTLCERAVALGYGEIGFAEHVDFFPGDRGFGHFDARAYGRAVAQVQARFAGRLAILKGVEVDVQERYLGDTARFLSGEEFDFVIGSVHWLDGRFIDTDGLQARPLEQTYRIYERETRALIGAGMFDILGHLDYIRSRASAGSARPELVLRRAQHHVFDPDPSVDGRRERSQTVEGRASGLFAQQELGRWLPLMADLTRQAAGAGLVLEANVKADRVAVPTRETVRAYLEAGGPGITVGTDSHHLWQFEGGWERTRAYLKEAGVREVTLFSARQRRVVAL